MAPAGRRKSTRAEDAADVYRSRTSMPHEEDGGRRWKGDVDATANDDDEADEVDSRFTKEELGTASAMSAMATLAEAAVDHGRNSANSSRDEDAFAPRGLPGATAASQKSSSAAAAFRNSLISNSNNSNTHNHASSSAPPNAGKAGRGKAGAGRGQSARSTKAKSRKQQQPKKEEVEREDEEEEVDELQGDDDDDEEMDIDKTTVEGTDSSGAGADASNASLAQNGRGRSADAVTQPEGGAAASTGMAGAAKGHAANATASSASPTAVPARDENSAAGMHYSASPTLAAATSNSHSAGAAASASQRPKVAKMVLQPIPPFRGGSARAAPSGPVYPTQFNTLRASHATHDAARGGGDGYGDTMTTTQSAGNLASRLTSASSGARKRVSGNGLVGAAAGPPAAKRIVTDSQGPPPPSVASQPPKFPGNVPPAAPGTGDLTPEEIEKFLQLVERHNPPSTTDESVMAESVAALYEDWLHWCAKTGRKSKPKPHLMAEFVTIHNGHYGPYWRNKAHFIASTPTMQPVPLPSMMGKQTSHPVAAAKGSRLVHHPPPQVSRPRMGSPPAPRHSGGGSASASSTPIARQRSYQTVGASVLGADSSADSPQGPQNSLPSGESPERAIALGAGSRPSLSPVQSRPAALARSPEGRVNSQPDTMHRPPPPPAVAPNDGFHVQSPTYPTYGHRGGPPEPPGLVSAHGHGTLRTSPSEKLLHGGGGPSTLFDGGVGAALSPELYAELKQQVKEELRADLNVLIDAEVIEQTREVHQHNRMLVERLQSLEGWMQHLVRDYEERHSMQPPPVGGPPLYVSSQPPPLPPGSTIGGAGPVGRAVSRMGSDGSRRSFESQASPAYAPREPMMKTSPRSSEARALPGGAHWGSGPPHSNGPPPPRRPSMERFQYSPPQNAPRPLPPYVDRQQPPPPPHLYGERSAEHRPPFDDRYSYATEHPPRGPPFMNYGSRGPPPPTGPPVWQEGPYPPRFADGPPKGMPRGRDEPFPQAKRARYD